MANKKSRLNQKTDITKGKKSKKDKEKAEKSRNPFAEAGMRRVIVPVDTSVYPLDAVYSAAYVFLDRAYIYLEKAENGKILVSLISKIPVENEKLLSLAGEFSNELCNQSIRASMDESSKKIREYIVVKSHYGQQATNTSLEALLDKTLKEALDEDPLEIAVPWEEKYGKASQEEKESQKKGGEK